MFFVITGSEGLLGRSVVARLAADGHDVVAVDRIAHIGEPVKNVVYHLSDLVDPSELIPKSKIYNPKFFLIHLAWDMRRFDGFGLQSAQVNLIAGMLDYWHRRGLERVMAMGSAEEFGSRAGHIRESDAPQFPLSTYGWSKRATRDLLDSWSGRTGIPAVWLRPFIMYGPGQRGDQLIPAAIAAAKAKTRTAFTDGQQMRDFVYVDDVVEAVAMAAGNPLNGFHEFNLGAGGVIIADVLRAIARHYEVNELFELGARPRRPGEPDVQIAECARARNLLGWNARVSWHDGLARCLQSSVAA